MNVVVFESINVIAYDKADDEVHLSHGIRVPRWVVARVSNCLCGRHAFAIKAKAEIDPGTMRAGISDLKFETHFVRSFEVHELKKIIDDLHTRILYTEATRTPKELTFRAFSNALRKTFRDYSADLVDC